MRGCVLTSKVIRCRRVVGKTVSVVGGEEFRRVRAGRSARGFYWDWSSLISSLRNPPRAIEPDPNTDLAGGSSHPKGPSIGGEAVEELSTVEAEVGHHAS